MGYIIVIARLPGIYSDINRSCPRATSSDSGWFTVIYPWPHAITRFWYLQSVGCSNKTKKATVPIYIEFIQNAHPHTQKSPILKCEVEYELKKLICSPSHTNVTSTMSTIYMYTTLEYELRYENKSTDLIWCLESVVCSLQ